MQLKKVTFMMGKLVGDLQALLRPIPVVLGPYEEQLGLYYIDFVPEFSKLNKLLHSFDSEGIPLNRPYVDVEGVGLHYYPISIGQYALALWNNYIHRGESTDGFMRIAQWFEKTAVVDEILGAYWLTEVPKPEYRLYRPWKSAFAQSRGISVLLRAWQHTGRDEYFHLASLALRPFLYDISEGGVSVDRARGKTFYEEYAADVPTRVLDGHIFSLFGLFDYMRATRTLGISEHNQARDLFYEGVEGLLIQLEEHYDMGWWLRYNRCALEGYPNDDPCTVGYLKLITAQLRILHAMTDDERLIRWHRRIKSYLRPHHILKMYVMKYKALKALNRL